MKVDLNGKIALVTGAAQGIGQSIAYALMENGARIAVNDLNANGRETAEEIRRRHAEARFYQADVSKVDEVNTMVNQIEEDLGAIDILINNAGINFHHHKERHPVHEFLDSDWEKILGVDLNGVFNCSRAVSARMVRRKVGSIVNIGSVLGIVPIRLQSAYAAAKAAVLHLTRSQALEVGPYGIRVNSIAPGSVLTEGTKTLFYNPSSKSLSESLLSHVPLGRPGEPRDIANAVLYLASDDAKYVTGHVLVVDGGWTAGFAREW